MITLVGLVENGGDTNDVAVRGCPVHCRCYGGACTSAGQSLFPLYRCRPEGRSAYHHHRLFIQAGGPGTISSGYRNARLQWPCRPGWQSVAIVWRLGRELSKDGYLVLLPNSFGSRGHGDLCAVQPSSARPVQPNREVPRDSYGAMAYLRTRPDVKPNSIAILGQSFGAASMFYAIAEGARPKELAAEQDFRAAIAFYPGCQPFLAQEPKWKPRQRMLFLMGEADNFTPAAPCKELIAAIAASGGPPIETRWYPGVYHSFDHPNLPERVLTNVKLPPDGHSPTVGSNPEAREDAILKVKAFLAANLK